MIKALMIYLVVVAATLCSNVQTTTAAAPVNGGLDVMEMEVVPEGEYEVQLQLSGRNHTVTLAIKNNRAAFVKSTDGKLAGLRGQLELVGNGVFMARLEGDNHRATQFWIFKSDGTATVKEIPDRGEKQTAKPMKAK